ncbi:LysR family transcriptional regulator [Pseudophaeobacter sp.]|uniref:LysR family transcriptional regulator n=1 Tax=Pseudophaeobacter sp. TaxID=1971739 RepID=UPI003298799E
MNFATFDLNLLRVLDALFQEGSTVKAGARLGLSQSAVSGALSRLRYALDDTLFVRQGNRLVATDYAAALKPSLREELERIETLLAPPGAFLPAKAQGQFKIAASDFFAELLMPSLAAELNKTAPNLTVQLVDPIPDAHIDSLHKGGADLVITPETEVPDWVCTEPLFPSDFAILAREGNPSVQAIEAGDAMPLDLYCGLSHVVFSPEGNTQTMGDLLLARCGKTRHVAMTLPTFFGVCRAVSESDMIALVPAQLARKMTGTFRLRTFDVPFHVEPTLMVAAWHQRSDRTPMALWMRQQVFDILKLLAK